MSQARRVVIVEVEGGIDPTIGHRKDTPAIAEAFQSHGWEVFFVFYKDSTVDELLAHVLSLKVSFYVSRVDPAKYEDYTEAKYLEFLRALLAEGIEGSTEPDVMMKLGTKQVVHQLRDTKIGSSDVEIYRTKEELATGFLKFLQRHPEGCVLKQNRGAGGKGVFWIKTATSDVEGQILCREAHEASLRKFSSWDEFVDEFTLQFLPDSFLVSMPYYKNVQDGEVRCVMTQTKPICIVHKHPVADEAGEYFSCTVKSGARIEYIYDFQANSEWENLSRTVVSVLPELQSTLGIKNLPHLWTMDFLKNDDGKYVLGEINCSCFGFGVQNRVGEMFVESIVGSLRK
jgi:hypothetical protein